MIDMHLHTKWSDGSLQVSELVQKLKLSDINYASLTDHDCILGNEEFEKISDKYNIKTIYGVELECYYNLYTSSYLHMLCYNYKDIKKLNDFLEQERLHRIEAIKEAIERIKKIGIFTNLDEVKSMSCGRHLLINHLCILLEKKRFVKSRFEAYQMFLNPNSELYVNYPKITVEEIMKIIDDVGGIPVLAHPKRINMNKIELENYVSYLKKIGLKGIETYYSFNTKEEIEFCEYLSNKYELIDTVGSDWHCEEEKINFGNKYITSEKEKILKRSFFNE